MIKCSKATDSNGNIVNIRPTANENVTVKFSGNITEIKHTHVKSKGGTTRKISKSEYVDIRTGEIKEFNPQNKRSDDLISVNRSIELGRDIIRANCTNSTYCRFITLTYAENMTDSNKLANDYKNFLKRLPEAVKPFKWISAVEPQKRGAWHIHAIFIYNNTAPYIENSIISKAWKQGFVSIEAVDNCDDMGAYLCAYLTDLDISDQPNEITPDIKSVIDRNGVPKRIKKGARLCMYPSGMHIFRWSQNCIKPTKQIMPSYQADRLVKNHPLVYEKTSVIEDTENNFQNIINTRVFNKARKAVK